MVKARGVRREPGAPIKPLGGEGDYKVSIAMEAITTRGKTSDLGAWRPT